MNIFRSAARFRVGSGPAILLAAASLLFASRPVCAQQIRGTVLEVEGRRTLGGAVISLLASDGARLLQVETDSAGSFTAPLPRAGAYALRVERLGYETLITESFQVGATEILEVRVFVGVAAVPLAPVEVIARRREAPGAHPDFDRRVAWGRKTGDGHFFTREEIANSTLVRTSSLLMQVPFIRLVHTRSGSVLLSVADRDGFNCRAAVYMNGMEVDQSAGLDWLASLQDLQGIEVYRFRSEVPAELAAHGVCSAVAFWTRAEGGGRGWSWRRIALGGALFSGLMVIGFLR